MDRRKFLGSVGVLAGASVVPAWLVPKSALAAVPPVNPSLYGWSLTVRAGDVDTFIPVGDVRALWIDGKLIWDKDAPTS